MRKFFFKLFFVFSLVFAVCCSNVQKSVVYIDITDTAYQSAVKLQIRNIGDSVAGVASGFAIDNNTIMTAGHFCMSVNEGQIVGLLKEGIEIVVVNRNNELMTLKGAEIDAINEKLDLCTVKLNRHGVVPFQLASSYDVGINDKVIVVGGPLGIFPVTSKGRVVTKQSEGFPIVSLNDRLVVAALGTFGNSGGPVLNEHGEIIGVVMAKLQRYDGLLIAVHLNQINEFLKQEYGE